MKLSTDHTTTYVSIAASAPTCLARTWRSIAARLARMEGSLPRGGHRGRVRQVPVIEQSGPDRH